MITRENIAEVLNNISKEDVEKVFNSQNDYVALEVYIFNTEYVVELNSIDTRLCSDAEQIQMDGGIVTDKDEFLRLFAESGSINPYLIEQLLK